MKLHQYTINFDEPDQDAPLAGSRAALASEDMRQADLRAQLNSSDLYGAHDIFYISLGSGSSGNCAYVGTRQGGVLIDAGIHPDNVEPVLKANGIDIAKVKGICLTHDHSDHVRYAYSLIRRNKHFRLYCTNRVLNGILRRHSISKRIKDYHQPVFKEIPFNVAGFEITAFDVPHDASDSSGFHFEIGGKCMVVATDLGEVTDRARHYLSQAHYMMIEANYDLAMLLRGPYPEYLKARIRTSHGHLDNRDTASFLASVVNEKLKYVFLCHLSQDNNTPDTAYNEVKNALVAAGVTVGGGEETMADRKADLQLVVLPRHTPTRLYVFR